MSASYLLSFLYGAARTALLKYLSSYTTSTFKQFLQPAGQLFSLSCAFTSFFSLSSVWNDHLCLQSGCQVILTFGSQITQRYFSKAPLGSVLLPCLSSLSLPPVRWTVCPVLFGYSLCTCASRMLLEDLYSELSVSRALQQKQFWIFILKMLSDEVK